MRYVRGFGPVSARERQAADLFFQDLTGIPARAAPPPLRSFESIESIEAVEAVESIESEAWLEQQTPPATAPTAPQPYLPTGGRAFVPQQHTFNCAPAAFTVVPASFLPTRTTDANAAIDAALTAAGLDAAQRGRIVRAGLVPIATEFGSSALTELFARLRWSAADIVERGRGADRMLVSRLLIHIPGHFRELARRAPGPVEAYVLECLGWLLMATLRDAVASATSRNWWIPPAPAFVSVLPNPMPALTSEVQSLVTRHGYINTTMPVGNWNGRYQTWATGLPGKQWHSELNAARPGLPFYAGLVTIPAHVNTATIRASFGPAWTARVADTDALHAPHAAGDTTVTLAGLRNAVALRDCDNSNAHLPTGVLRNLGLQGLELAYEYPLIVGSSRTIRSLTLLTDLHPVYTALFETIRALGWNDLLYQTSGGGCFRGIKHPAHARVPIGGVQTLVNPFDAPNATTVTRINTNFNAAQRTRVVRATRTCRTMSEHGLGAAIDFNVPENEQNIGARPFGSMDPRLVALFEAFHFSWGACFNPTDPMHFEYCQAACAPAAVPGSGGIPPGPSGVVPGMIPAQAGPMIA
jgi:hypothetical protein